MVEKLVQMYEDIELKMSDGDRLQKMLEYMQEEETYILNRIKTLLIITRGPKNNPIIKEQRLRLEAQYEAWQSPMRDKTSTIDSIISESEANRVCSHGCNQGWTSPSTPCHCNPSQIRIGADER